jgi:hypothetical protein
MLLVQKDILSMLWDAAKVLQQKENAKRKCIGKGKGRGKGN